MAINETPFTGQLQCARKDHREDFATRNSTYSSDWQAGRPERQINIILDFLLFRSTSLRRTLSVSKGTIEFRYLIATLLNTSSVRYWYYRFLRSFMAYHRWAVPHWIFPCEG